MQSIQYKNNNNIVVIIFFFGELPWYYKYFLHSCSYNPAIDFLIFSDNEPPDQLPENVFFIKKSLGEMQELTSKKLDCDTTLNPQPYKFCDFRPAFGVIFQEYIKEYAFWGHGDLDVIYGNIRNFLTEELLSKYDVLSFRSAYLSSWFTIYRNSRKISQLFRKSRDYLKVFTTPKYYNFDETNFKFIEFFDGIPYQEITSEVESMTHLVQKLQEENYINAYFDLNAIERLTGNITWNKGQLTYKNEYEFILYHLKELKKKYQPEKPPKSIPDVFHISKSGINF